jgi:glycosyltransferase involved in cell wall biosynthesis
MVKRVLIIAYNFPPVLGSSAVQRTLAFTKYLPNDDWQPLILSVHPFAYPMSADDQLKEIPDGTIVKRSFAFDTVRHFGIKGRYPHFAALPDRWISWWFSAVPTGINLIRKYKPQAILTTYPIATANLIGMSLHKLAKLPWVADFRDSMTDDSFPSEGSKRKVFQWIEKRTIINCTKAVFTTPGAKNMYAQRYAGIPEDRWEIIENGFNEDNFTAVERKLNVKADKDENRPTTLVHSGILYTSERDPRMFFLALKELYEEGKIGKSDLRIILRGTRNDEYCSSLIREYGIQDIVSLGPIVPYELALEEMLTSDGLLIFQASNCNHQIPAKIYEYLRAKRPILALTDPKGDTADILQKAGVDSIARLDSMLDIKQKLQIFLERIKNGETQIASDTFIQQYNRESKTSELAKLLDSIVVER